MSIQWDLIKPARQRGRGDKLCHLCVSEKVFILRGDPDTMLNKRSEIMQKCRHKQELMLSNFYSRASDHHRELKRAHHRLNTPVVVDEEEDEERRPDESTIIMEIGGQEEEEAQTVETRRTEEGGQTEEEGPVLGGGRPVEGGPVQEEGHGHVHQGDHEGVDGSVESGQVPPL